MHGRPLTFDVSSTRDEGRFGDAFACFYVAAACNLYLVSFIVRVIVLSCIDQTEGSHSCCLEVKNRSQKDNPPAKSNAGKQVVSVFSGALFIADGNVSCCEIQSLEQRADTAPLRHCSIPCGIHCASAKPFRWAGDLANCLAVVGGSLRYLYAVFAAGDAILQS